MRPEPSAVLKPFCIVEGRVRRYDRFMRIGQFEIGTDGNLIVTRSGMAELHERVRPAGAGAIAIAVPRRLFRATSVSEPTARAWALSLIEELRNREPGWELVAEGLILQGIGRLERIDRLRDQRPSWIDRVLALARKQQPLHRIAALVGKHPSHIAREFRRHEGVSVGEYARRCRLELAARKLRADDAPIADIAFAHGFCDQSHFTNAFRRVFGVTPAAYRRRDTA
jgi:AraC family transcriptional regulator